MKKIAFALALLFLACSVAFAEETADTRPEVAQNIIIKLGDTELTNEEHGSELYRYILDDAANYGYDLEDEETLSMLKDLTLNYAAQLYVEDKLEHELGYFDVSDEVMAELRVSAQEDYDYTYELLREQYAAGGTPEEDLDDEVLTLMNEHDYTVDSIVQGYLEEDAYYSLYAHYTDDVTVSEEEVRAKFDAQVEADRVAYENDPNNYSVMSMYGYTPYYAPAGMRNVKHILICYEDTSAIDELMALSERPEDYDAQYESAKLAAYAAIEPRVTEVLARLAAGEDFDALSDEYNEDPGSASGTTYHDVGYTVFEGCSSLVAEFVDGGMGLAAIGDYTTEPVLTSYGAHIMLYASDVPSGPAEFTDSIRAELEYDMLEEAKQEAYSNAIQAEIDKYGALYLYPENLVAAEPVG